MTSMKVLMSALVVSLFSSVALANETQTEFYAPQARAVMLVGGENVQVCSFNRDWPTPHFVCVDKPYTGEFEAPWMTNIVEGPVRVIGAEWAFYLPACEGIGFETSFYVEDNTESCHDRGKCKSKPKFGGKGKDKGYPDVSVGVDASGNTCPGWVEMQAREMPVE